MYEVITDATKLPTFHKDKPLFSDIETRKLYIDTRLVSMYQPEYSDTVYIFDLAPVGYNEEEYESTLQTFKDYLKDFWCVWYNGAYDLGTLNMNTARYDDLFFASKIAFYKSQSFSLDKLLEYLNLGYLYEGLDKKSLQKKGFKLGVELSDDQLKYSAMDVYALKFIWERLEIQEVLKSNKAYKLDTMSQTYAIDYQQNGIDVDIEEIDRLVPIEEAKVLELQAKITEGLNVNSPKQIVKYLGTKDSAKDTLTLLLASDISQELKEEVDAILKLRVVKKRLSYLKSVRHEKMYTKFNASGASTGRFSAKGGDLENGFNAQNIPRAFSAIFTATVENTAIVSLDYATLQLRIACAIYKDYNMYKRLKDGVDLHTTMAIEVSGKQLHSSGVVKDDSEEGKSGKYVTKGDRTKAKAVNFGFIFGMTAKKFVIYAYVNYGLVISLEEASQFRRAFFRTYPDTAKYHKYCWDNVDKPDFYLVTALGRKIKPKAGTEAINCTVQGSEGECTKLALHYLLKLYPEALNYIFNVVHDSVYLRVPKDEYDLWKDRLATSMLKGWEQISKSTLFKFKDIPMQVD